MRNSHSLDSLLRFAAPVAAAAALMLAACSTDSDSKAVEVTYKGRLSDLDSSRVDSAQASYRQWVVPADTSDTRELKGKCNYTAYVADSLGLEADEVNAQYTNTLMGGRTKTAAMIRAEGIRLYLDTTSSMSTPNFYTHYRVDLTCE